MQTFTENERLKEKKLIDALFSKGRSLRLGPLTLLWFAFDSGKPGTAKILISASSKKLKRAVDRNLMKRRMRESYRKNKSGLIEFLEKKCISCVFAFLYSSSGITSYAEVEEKIIQLIERFQTNYEKGIG
ncbi:MAG: ribonuclease P protein component [Bacteroidetes bacterium]|nr:ribonuclease P protein component [Bacteroidota bacterium]